MAGWHHTGKFKQKLCVVCSMAFVPVSGVHKFCSVQCKGKYQHISGKLSTENQYKTISGNWLRYFQRLACRSHKRVNIKAEDLLALLEKQKGECALTGIELTCKLEKGVKHKTNASIDRIIAGKEYSIDNVQLVCSAVNSWRSDADLNEFIYWCKLVAKKHGGT